jgi:hypothetical protein
VGYSPANLDGIVNGWFTRKILIEKRHPDHEVV